MVAASEDTEPDGLFLAPSCCSRTAVCGSSSAACASASFFLASSCLSGDSRQAAERRSERLRACGGAGEGGTVLASVRVHGCSWRRRASWWWCCTWWCSRCWCGRRRGASAGSPAKQLFMMAAPMVKSCVCVWGGG
ncbi:uncharacterized protein IUM83_02757 [Phytophthora cinnamomi]|uniref:uncharacterized protein n=1 Tax=Phytophthora cinnamomi TaxID=4785 RepID=UPI003559CCA3|nr:hypothetical protein IUM83_02757 [Phytophthora cinnamomi]